MQALWLSQVSHRWEIKNTKNRKKSENQPIILSGEFFTSDIYRRNPVSSSQRISKSETHYEKITSRTLNTTITFLEKNNWHRYCIYTFSILNIRLRSLLISHIWINVSLVIEKNISQSAYLPWMMNTEK